MASTIITASPIVIPVLSTFLILSLGILTGVAVSLRFWTMPSILRSDSTTIRIDQYNYVIALGLRYLQPSSRLFPVPVLSLAYLHYSSDDMTIQGRWVYYVAAVVVLMATAPWEEYFIFPINRKVEALGKELSVPGPLEDSAKGNVRFRDNFGDEKDNEVEELFANWMKWHWGRIILPATAFALVVVARSGLV